MTHEEVHYTPKELYEFSNLYRQKPGEYVWEWILRVWDNGGRNIRLDQAEFTDMGPLSRDSAFNVVARGVRKGVNSLGGWLNHGSKGGRHYLRLKCQNCPGIM